MDPQATPPPEDGSAPHPFVPYSVEELAPLFPGLHIERLIAVGGMGGVYLARQLNLDRPVALKLLPPADGREINTAERFAHEARLMAQLSHPNIVSIYDFGQSQGLYYFIMEYVHGATFHELIQANRIDASNATQLMIPICSGVSYAHKRGVLHHDLKPGNLMLSDEHNAKLLDFGLAGIFKPGHRDAAAATWGTADYAAPERSIPDAPIDHRADIYSLGVIYYQMLTGKIPKSGDAPPSKVTGLNPKVDEIVKKSIANNPDDRYPTVEAFEADLRKLLKLPKIKSKASRGALVPAKAPNKKGPRVAAAPKRPAAAGGSPVKKSSTASAKSLPKTAVANPARAGSSATRKRRPPEPQDEAKIAAQKQAQAEFQERMKADKKRREIQIAIILLLGGAIAIGLIVFFLAN